MQDFAPKGPVETDRTQAVADGRWRMKRAAQNENAIVAIARRPARPDEVRPGYRIA
jgi:hypothetical protein